MNSNENLNGMNPNVVKTSSYGSNHGLEPSPLIPKGRKTLGMVEIASESPEIDKSTSEQSNSDFTINLATDLGQKHAPHFLITHGERNLLLKNHANTPPDAPPRAIGSDGNLAKNL